MTKDFILQADELALKVMEKELFERYNYKWKTASGEILNVKDMTDSHLRNTINKLKRYLYEREIVLENYSGDFEWWKG